MTPETHADLLEMMDKAKLEAPVKGWLPYAALTAALAELDAKDAELALLRIAVGMVVDQDWCDCAECNAYREWRAKYGART
jgi:hypothetical protein